MESYLKKTLGFKYPTFCQGISEVTYLIQPQEIVVAVTEQHCPVSVTSRKSNPGLKIVVSLQGPLVLPYSSLVILSAQRVQPGVILAKTQYARSELTVDGPKKNPDKRR